ncbi:alpha/beta hydrolase [Actinotalea sp. M2MS4P-6]|uniref:alpha/beta fold hydrolase n=1 Tax=Actinotalea sp. M2MS4P-6 TaxID=2983762 RepID=UPI0021E4E5FB|nr:alpha/beta hydrolase [Actinotalea sp. M2MS4P-6]MCV2392958.1 alpha/beta hydrolase [Actinotalea sp. M2MS4P-6]
MTGAGGGEALAGGATGAGPGAGEPRVGGRGGGPEPFAVREGLARYVFGQGPPVLFMPGPHRFQRPGLRSADALIDGLVALGRSVVTFDPPGSGRSTRPAHLGMAEMHACALEALDAAGVTGPVDALGHSMGGLTLLAFALDHPDRIRRLVLVGTGRGGGSYLTAPGSLWSRKHRAFPAVAALGSVHLVVGRLGSERVLNNLIERHSFVDRGLCRPAPVEWRDWFRPRRGRADWHRIARKLDYGPRLGELDLPALVLCGAQDPQFPPACSAELAGGIRGARLELFDASGHYPFIEEPERFWDAVGAFLGEPTVPGERAGVD